jgi:hypothetical protein
MLPVEAEGAVFKPLLPDVLLLADGTYVGAGPAVTVTGGWEGRLL